MRYIFSMANMFDYFSWRGDLDFDQSPLNPADNVIFCQLSYLPMDGIVPPLTDAAASGISIGLVMDILSKNLQSDSPDDKPYLMFKDDPVLIGVLGSSKRFRDCRLFGYVNHIDADHEKQFSAVSVNTGDDSCFIAYRGTDSTFVGWKEDANMSFKDAIPAQLEAVEYLEKIASIVKGPLRTGGHSKGGNLAVYAASFCSKKTQKRITDIYSNDAPGFHEHVINGEGFAAIKNRIRSFIPQGSVVGMIFENGCDYTVIKSSQSGLLQHDLYSWEMTHNNMVQVDHITAGSRFVDKTLKDWIGKLDNERRKQFLGVLYGILSASGVKTIPELERDWFNAAGRMIKSIGKIDSSTRMLVHATLAELFNAARKNLYTFIKP